MLSLLVTQSKPTFGQSADEFEQIFAHMTPEERIGQVFLVAFEGDVENFRIQELIRDLKIGGVSPQEYAVFLIYESEVMPMIV